MGLDSGHVQGGIQKLGLVSEIQELNFASLGLDLGEVRGSMSRARGLIWMFFGVDFESVKLNFGKVKGTISGGRDTKTDSWETHAK